MTQEELKQKRIGVLMGGLSAEREISLKSGMAVHQALLAQGYDSTALDVRTNIADLLQQDQIDLAFIALHGRYGEDGCIQGLLELAGIPYTGSGVLASALAMHKLYSKLAFSAAGLTITPYVSIMKGKTVLPESLPFTLPVVVKPVQEGSSVGVSIVKEAGRLQSALDDAFLYDDLVLIEQYVKGKEVQVGILNNQPIGAIEIVPKNEFYDFEAKYSDGMAEHIFPARLSPDIYQKVQQLGLKAHQALGCEGYCRVDFIVSEAGDCYLLEVNTLPGMTALSLLPEIAQKGAGLSFEQLVKEIACSAALKTGQNR
jgi:D-alanine-D-alanine ligase